MQDRKQEALKPVISVAQALLLLIDKNKANPDHIKELKELYLLGAVDQNTRSRIDQWMKDEHIVNNFIVDRSPECINSDSTRRYFESVLAYETLKSNIKYVDLDSLEAHKNNLIWLIQRDMPTWYSYVTRTIEGKITADEKIDKVYHEYSEAINRVNLDPQYKKFSPDERKKIILMMQSSFLGTIVLQCSNNSKTYPIPIYGEGFYSPQKRGLKLKLTENSQVRSHHLGLMRSTMPLPKNDMLYTDKPSQALRATDGSTYDIKAEWPEKNFETLVNPFSCAISGTMLCQLRVIKHLNNKGQQHIEMDEPFIKAFSSLMLFCSGGHSFREFLTPLTLPEVKEAFPSLQSFSMKDSLLTTNKDAFNHAIDAAIEYNKLILKRQMLLDSIKMSPTHLKLKPVSTQTSLFLSSIPTEVRELAITLELSPIELWKIFQTKPSAYDRICNLACYIINFNHGVRPGLSLTDVMATTEEEKLNLMEGYYLIMGNFLTIHEVMQLKEEERLLIATHGPVGTLEAFMRLQEFRNGLNNTR